MKNVCILLRNAKHTLNFDGVLEQTVNLFTRNGFPFRKVSLLAYDDVAALHEELAREMSSCNVLCLLCERVLLEGVRSNLQSRFSFSFSDEGIVRTSGGVFCLIPFGKEETEGIETRILPKLSQAFSCRYAQTVIKMVGADLKTIQTALRKAYSVSGDAVTYNFTDRYADQQLELVYADSLPKKQLSDVIRLLLEEVKEQVYSVDGRSLEESVYELLKLRKRKLSVAESFTGGGVAARLVSVPGVSEVYFEGLNTYDSRAKSLRLGVKEQTLQTYGAASAETAHEMAKGLFTHSDCTVCVATTGVAGPKPEGHKPAGLCYISAGIDGKIFVNQYNFQGDRQTVTQTAINYALFAVYKLLK